jgi:hypothetical protein
LGHGVEMPPRAGKVRGKRSPPMVLLHVEHFPCALRAWPREPAGARARGGIGTIADCVRHWL